MRALTLHQPWAAAIVHGTKRIENRLWRPPDNVIGEQIAIHASVAKGHEHLDEDYVRQIAGSAMDSWPMVRGAIVGVATVAGWVGAINGAPRWRLDGTGLCPEDVLSDPWWMGPFGWVLTGVKALSTPVYARGMQRLWTVSNDARECVELALNRQRG